MLRDAGILIRPHPERLREWDGVSFDGLPNVAVHGSAPIAGDAKADYFDSLYCSAAVVGLCTSAFLEAAILGRPVLTLQLPAYRLHQEGMAHFRYLLNVEGGLLQTSMDMASHVAQLGRTLRGDAALEERRHRFLRAFVRPYGLDVAATPRFADAVERLSRAVRGERRPLPVPLSTRLVAHVSAAARSGIGAWLLMDAADVERVQRDRATDQGRRQRAAERAARLERKQRAHEEAVRQAEHERLRKRERVLERERAKAAARDERLRADEERDRRKRRVHRWRRWRYRLGTTAPLMILKRGLRR
jgi:hypothetical protein